MRDHLVGDNADHSDGIETSSEVNNGADIGVDNDIDVLQDMINGDRYGIFSDSDVENMKWVSCLQASIQLCQNQESTQT